MWRVVLRCPLALLACSLACLCSAAEEMQLNSAFTRPSELGVSRIIAPDRRKETSRRAEEGRMDW